MCGIYGYIGPRQDAAHIVLAGLKDLEYRGYDSWGVAWAKNGNIKIKKQIGKIGNATLPKEVDATLAIGHTRWATHGGVTQKNAHPHKGCGDDVAVVHNGIVENYKELKEKLIKLGHTFSSETDTEVIVHLIEEMMKKYSFQDSVKKTLSQLHGMNAVLVLNKKDQTIAAYRNGSPLIIGIGENEFFVASDVNGIGAYTKKVIFLEEKQLVFLSKDGAIYNGIKPKVQTLSDHLMVTDKGKFDHFMVKEINEQPSIIKNLLTREKEIKKFADTLKGKRLSFIGCGTAYYAALMSQYIFAKIARVEASSYIGSEFNLFESFIKKNDAAVFFSQSGETIDLIENANKLIKRGVPIYSIVNKPYSSLERLSKATFHLLAGAEVCVLATKSYIAKVTTALLTAGQLANDKSVAKDVEKAAKVLKTVLSEKFSKDHLASAVKYLVKKDHIFVIGRGLNYPLAHETALKIKEGTYIHAESFAGGDLKHGPIALIEKGTPCICLANNDETYNDIISNAMEIKARGGFIIGVSPKANSVFDIHIPVGECGPAWAIPAISAMQLLAYKMMLQMGRDPDKPRNLAKSVTVK